MRTPQQASTNPWGTSVDDGWKDLVVSSAPPPPPREALQPIARNRPLPDNFDILTEHGAPRVAAPEAPVDEPTFTRGDRRLWIIAGSLMAMATLVLGVLGLLTFGNGAVAAAPAAETPHAAAAAVEPARAAVPSHETVKIANAVVVKSSNPRVLKAASRTKHGRHHAKKIAQR